MAPIVWVFWADIAKGIAMSDVQGTVVKNVSMILALVILASASRFALFASQERPAADAQPQSFEVASIRANRSGSSGLTPLIVRPNGSLVATNAPLRGLIRYAYGIMPYDSIEGGGDVLEERFDVEARAGAPQKVVAFGQVGPLNIMMQNLLAERFGLVVRWEAHLGEGYALVRSRADGSLGPGIHPSDLECPRTTPSPPNDARDCDVMIIDNVLTVEGHRMTDFARLLATYYERPVTDRTELDGWFTFSLRFNARELPMSQRLLPPRLQHVDSGLPSLFTVLQEDLGLKLQPEQVTIPRLIVEQVHALIEN